MLNKTLNPQTTIFLESLLSGDRKKCSSIAKQYLSQNPSVKDLYEEVFKEALYEVGRLWETNKISVASEHLATAITEGILNELYAEMDVPENVNHKVVLSCVENELHQVGIKMVADVFEMNGWETYFLGTGIPSSELINFIKEIKPDILAISLSIFFNYQNLLRMIDRLKMEFPDLTIIIGGQAFSHKKEDNFKKIEGVLYITDLFELDNYIKKF